MKRSGAAARARCRGGGGPLSGRRRPAPVVFEVLADARGRSDSVGDSDAAALEVANAAAKLALKGFGPQTALIFTANKFFLATLCFCAGAAPALLPSFFIAFSYVTCGSPRVWCASPWLQTPQCTTWAMGH